MLARCSAEAVLLTWHAVRPPTPPGAQAGGGGGHPCARAGTATTCCTTAPRASPALDLGFLPSARAAAAEAAAQPPKVVFLLGSDDFAEEDVPAGAFVIYQVGCGGV